MIEIRISSSLINNSVFISKKINTHLIEKKIYDLLINDGKIDCNFANISWIIDQKMYQGITIPSINEIICFTQMTDDSGKCKSRNTFVMQNSRPIFKLQKYYQSKGIFYGISLSINPFNLGQNIKLSNSIINDINSLMTVGVVLNKSIKHLTNSTKISDLNEYLLLRRNLKNKMKQNNSTYISIDPLEKSLYLYGRLEGALFQGTYITAKLIKRLAVNSIYKKFYFIDISSDHSSKWDPIIDLGYQLIDTEIVNNDIRNAIVNNDSSLNNENLKRNQSLFFKQIIMKYQDIDVDQCFACNYQISENLINAHIHRYADIINEYKNKIITIDEAVDLITSGDNGFRFCPNHDKEFEKGMIIFDIDKLQFVANPIKYSSLSAIINSNITKNSIKKWHINNQFSKNISKHLKRVQ